MTPGFMGFPVDRGDNPPLSGHDRVTHNACVPLTHNSYLLPTPPLNPMLTYRCSKVVLTQGCSNSASLCAAGNFSYSPGFFTPTTHVPLGTPPCWTSYPMKLLCDPVRPNIAGTIGADMATSGGYLWLIKPHEGANQGNSQTPLGYQR